MSIDDLRKKGRRLRGDSGNVVSLDARRKEPLEIARVPHENSKFTQETVDTIIAAVQGGNYYTTAAHLAGISVNTLYRWIKKGENGEKPFDEFYEAIQEAEAIAESSLVHVVSAAAKTDYKAGLELLSRRFPERWSTRQRHELTGDNGGPVELVVMFDGDEEVEETEEEYDE